MNRVAGDGCGRWLPFACTSPRRTCLLPSIPTAPGKLPWTVARMQHRRPIPSQQAGSATSALPHEPLQCGHPRRRAGPGERMAEEIGVVRDL
jgi:hypothetical protein